MVLVMFRIAMYEHAVANVASNDLGLAFFWRHGAQKSRRLLQLCVEGLEIERCVR